MAHTEDYPDFFQVSCDITPIHYGGLYKFLRENDIVMVMYYNPTFKSCKAMRPVYQAAAEMVNRPNVAFAAVNCGKDSDLCVKEGVAFDLPQFKAYAYGQKVGDLDKSITANEIVRYVEKLNVGATLRRQQQDRYY